MKSPFTKSPRANEIEPEVRASESKLEQVRSDLRAAEEARSKLPFGTAAEELERTNQKILSLREMVAALFQQVNEGSRLHREALAAEYPAAASQKFDAMCETARGIHQAALTLETLIGKMMAQQDEFKTMARPVQAAGKGNIVIGNPLTVALRRRQKIHADATGSGPAPRQDDARNTLNSFAQNREIVVGRGYSGSELAALFEIAAALKSTDAESKAA